MAHWADGLSEEEKKRWLDATVSWQASVVAFIDSFADKLPAEDIERAQFHVAHREAPEGVRDLAFSIVDANIPYDRAVAQRIMDWTEGFMGVEDLPAEMVQLLGESPSDRLGEAPPVE